MELFTVLGSAKVIIKDLFFPKSCFNCQKEGNFLCSVCRGGLFFNTPPFCPFCKRIYDRFLTCAQCKNFTGIDGVFSLFSYQDRLVRALIKHFKYRFIKEIPEELEDVMRAFFIKYNGLLGDFSGWVIVPVPLFWYQFCYRGFNQSLEIARIIAKIIKAPVADKLLIKWRPTKNQAKLPDEKRILNTTGAFAVKEVSPQKILLIDDVFTTGATVKSCAMALRKAGAKEIRVLTLARG